MPIALVLAAALATVQPDCAARQESARPTIEHANGDWIRALKAGDGAAIAAAYAEDGIFVLPDGAVIRGRAAVQALYAKSGPAVVGGGIESQGLVCGPPGILYEWGRGVVRSRDAEGRESERGGDYLTVWRQVGADWRIVRNLAF
ncbi:MAG: hypothetical protein DI570_24225 [Phenylobacterium zucineum]|nr:MAG: hypothetical protein DI570_24225 [Phenylobacterium zucineum]